MKFVLFFLLIVLIAQSALGVPSRDAGPHGANRGGNRGGNQGNSGSNRGGGGSSGGPGNGQGGTRLA
ncbi:H/ACA ribonucleoprotein complex subunit 1-like [Anoplophora glabripennis]|uniref:H/ACA ribonucleoprotein complex subunit 1-like n=1 Tax=Anoplophora glabripennis TaxID=217634 RepID=UPI0008737B12|nr:H/ACA ribonucleoprotein complex subunit 1-like [Anoplophora glabripennis]